MFCAISGEVPSEPVFCIKTQLIYEKSLILKSLELSPKCPVTGIAVDAENDIIEVQTASALKTKQHKDATIVPPRDHSMTSIPEILRILGKEWDSVMLETFELKKQLQITREELVKTLYERDAACRVIARLRTENEELANGAVINHSTGEKTGVKPSATVKESGHDLVKSRIGKASQLLVQRRKERRKQGDSVVSEPMTSLKLLKLLKAHKTTKPVVSCVCASKDGSTVLSAGEDGTVYISSWDGESLSLNTSFSAHAKAITHISLSANEKALLTVSEDKTAILWTGDSLSSLTEKNVLFLDNEKISRKPMTLLDGFIHPSQDLVLIMSDNGCYSFWDFEANSVNEVFFSDKIYNVYGKEGGFSAVDIHVDGVLMAFAKFSENKIALWDLMSDVLALEIEIPTPENGSLVNITHLEFSENGFHLAVGGENCFDIVDLRKQSIITNEDFDKEFESDHYIVHASKFDISGKLIAVSYSLENPTDEGSRPSKKARVGDKSTVVIFFLSPNKQFKKIHSFEIQEIVTDISFTSDSKSLLIGTNQRSIQIYSA